MAAAKIRKGFWFTDGRVGMDNLRIKEAKVKELQDYSGPFNPDITYMDLSKELLCKLYNAAGRLLLMIDASWQGWATEKLGWEEALAAEQDVWCKRYTLPSYKIMREVLNIQNNDVEAVMKHLQLDPTWPSPLYDVKFEMPEKDRGLITVNKCTAVLYWERKGDLDRLCDICYKMEPDAFQNYMTMVNPDIIATPLVRPPRKSPDDICCQWEITYKPK